MTGVEWLVCDDPLRMLLFLEAPASGGMSGRKARLFACAACRRSWQLVDEGQVRKLVEFARTASSFEGLGRDEPPVDCCHRALEMAERGADEVVDEEKLGDLAEKCGDLDFPASDYCACFSEGWTFDGGLLAAGSMANAVSDACSGDLRGVVHNIAEAAVWLRQKEYGDEPEGADRDEMAALCALLRDIVPNPPRAAPDALRQTQLALSLAQAAYEERELPSGLLDKARLAVLSDALEEAGCTDEAILSHLRSPGPHVRGCWALDLVLGKQ